ncbi:MAG: ROK family transcriptional regulator [Marmoricola sp.]
MARGNGGSAREANRQRVIEALLGRGGNDVTYAQLAHDAGLAIGTVSSIVREFEEAGMVDTVPGAGRRGATVRLGRGAGLVAGVDFGHTHLAVAIADMTGSVLAERTVPADADQDRAASLVLARAMIDQLVAEAGEKVDAVRTVGMGLPAPMSHGRVLGTAIMPGWADVQISAVAERAFGRPVVVENDANLGALAECHQGAGRGHSEVVFVKVSSGLGAGIVVDGRIFAGASGIAGELGHLTYDEQGPLCRCGSRGCLEAYTSSRMAREMMAGHLPHAQHDEIVAAAMEGNVAARRVFEDAGWHLGWGFAMVANLLNPGIIVVGGDMARAGDLLLDSARSGMRRHVLAGAETTPVVTSELGDRASLVGAVMLAVDATNLAQP